VGRLLPDPDLSKPVFRRLNPALQRAHEHGPRTVPPGFLRTCRHLLGAAAGKRRIPRCLQPA
jgi:hypothetical protein